MKNIRRLNKVATKAISAAAKIKKGERGRRRLKRTRGGSRIKKQLSGVQLVRSEENPIIRPNPENNWEAEQTFNPTAILLEGKIHFLYRAIGSDGISRLGYAVSSDGFTIDERLPHPVYEHKASCPRFSLYSYLSGGSFGGSEDPRIVRVGQEDVLYMTYTACDNGLRVALTSISVDDFLKKRWRWAKPVLISPPGQVHKNWVIFPKKINGRYAILHSLSPKILVDYFDSLEFNGKTFIKSFYSGVWRDGWDAWVRGVGPVPIETQYGWLIFYHAMSADDFSKYKVGAALLDSQDPTKVIKRSLGPVLEPEEVYENNGFKPGVVYASGAVVKDGTLLLYYGGADSYSCVAYANLNEFCEAIIRSTKPKLERKVVKKRRSLVYDY